MARQKLFMRALLIAVLLFLGACSSAPKDLGNRSLVVGDSGPTTYYKGSSVRSFYGDVDSALVVPDGAGGVIVLPGSPHKDRNRGYVDARELKLKVRELGEQLVAGMEDCSLQGTVAMPVSFVDLNDFSQTSPLGRLIAEQLYHELNQRGYPVKEYRMQGSVRMKEREGEFALSRSLGKATAKSSVVIVGTYQYDKEAVFINARLVRPGDGRVLRTANLVLESNDLTKRMLRGTGSIKKLASGGMGIRDFRAATRPPAVAQGNLTPFDKGEDIH